jgi:predicted MFS family arabinose efflux permease
MGPSLGWRGGFVAVAVLAMVALAASRRLFRPSLQIVISRSVSAANLASSTFQARTR